MFALFNEALFELIQCRKHTAVVCVCITPKLPRGAIILQVPPLPPPPSMKPCMETHTHPRSEYLGSLAWCKQIKLMKQIKDVFSEALFHDSELYELTDF